MTKVKNLCRHCKKNVAHRPRGLCYRCYYTPTICRQYQPLRRTGIKDFYGFGKPCKPTQHLPGTKAKVEVFIARAIHAMRMFHPRDATLKDYQESFRQAAKMCEIIKIEK